MSTDAPKVHFWAKLEFVNEKAEARVDFSRGLWRPDFFYVLGDPDGGYMIWPIDREGDEFGFYVLNPELWEAVHRARIKPGLVFFVTQAGTWVDAVGTVTRRGNVECLYN